MVAVDQHHLPCRSRSRLPQPSRSGPDVADIATTLVRGGVGRDVAVHQIGRLPAASGLGWAVAYRPRLSAFQAQLPHDGCRPALADAWEIVPGAQHPPQPAS
jgi:hypothetical protein